MLFRVAIFLSCLALVTECDLLAGQRTAPATASAPRPPDLQGLWTNSTTTPLERPSNVGAQTIYSDEEIAAIDAANVGRNDRLPPAGDPGTYNDFWWERGTALASTSLIIAPPNGRLPEKTRAGEDRSIPTRLPWRRRPGKPRCTAWRYQRHI